MTGSRWFSLIGFSLALLFAVGSLQAQDATKGGGARPGRGGFGGGFMGGMGQSKVFLAFNQQVQTELKLDQATKDKLTELQKTLQGTPPNRGDTKSMTPEDRKKASEKRMEDQKKAAAEAEKKLPSILSADQLKRLNGIYIQRSGIQALKDEAIATELKLTAEQKTKIADALKASQDEVQKLMPTGGKKGGAKTDYAEIRTKSEQIRKDTETKVLAILTAEQKTQFEAMKGAEFKMERQATGAGGGRGGRNAKKSGEGAGTDAKS